MAKILVVDDSRSLRQMVCFTLREAGYDIMEATNGVEALEVAEAESADLVLTDVNMPQMDGITLVGKLRELSSYRFTPILILTTESTTDMKMKGKQAGATGWLVKPFDPDKLLATIQRVLR
ncbi:response regulator [Persicimonas caeni]|uniref:Response regulator n=1 Tax=Persicimonas caeni TaxID=2292766 RepID=A0A4Y6PZ34_PERCE|nr:response regulator [Persicimonas caeni]QDG53586.1 response regulator [Persicimonas caeni]QED34807.1 response regulator [Persicimonas caeni]